MAGRQRRRQGALTGGGAEDANMGVGGEALGGGGRGAHRWRGGTRSRRKSHSSTGRHGAEEVGV
jgi:hypothetical protein